MAEGRTAFNILSGTCNIPLGRPWLVDLVEIGGKTRNWIESAKDEGYWGALLNAALNLRVS